MGFTVTFSRRRLAMAALLALAMTGAVIRIYAPNPSTLRDVGTLLLVLWLPAVGNVIAFFVRKIPMRAPPATDFAAGSAFTPHLQVLMEAVSLPGGWMASLDPAHQRCTVLVGRQAFTARVAQPLVQMLAVAGPQTLALEVLHPEVALPKLRPGTGFHLLVGVTAVAKGRVEQIVAADGAD